MPPLTAVIYHENNYIHGIVYKSQLLKEGKNLNMTTFVINNRMFIEYYGSKI